MPHRANLASIFTKLGEARLRPSSQRTQWITFTRRHRGYANSKTVRTHPFWFISPGGNLFTGRNKATAVPAPRVRAELLNREGYYL